MSYSSEIMAQSPINRPLSAQHDDSEKGLSQPWAPEPAHLKEQLDSIDSQTPSHGSNSTLPTSGEQDLTSRTDSTHSEPKPRYGCGWMNVLRWEWLSVYRRLNLIVLLANICVIVGFAAEGGLVRLSPATMATALAANVMTAVIFRQEYVVNLLFLVFGCCPSWFPLWIKRLAAKIYHFGGIHSGAGMASIVWLALFDMSLVLSLKGSHLTAGDYATASLTGTLNLLLCSIVLSSHPKFRERHHNIWEKIHRFGGWLAVALFWVAFGLLTEKSRQRSRQDESIARVFVTSPAFWMLVVVTFCLVLPWLRLRKVPVYAEHQSKYAIRLHFTYTDLPLCAAPRFSTSPLVEWHSFAGIPEESGHGFSVLISGIGDWTKKIIAEPPKYLWTRGIPVRGVLHLAPIFTRIILVATGSGIGPVLSLLHAREVDCRILWCTRDPESSYQPDVLAKVRQADPRACIIARVKGQRDPDLGKMAYDLYQESGAEAVFIISNKEGCYSARIWLESRGVVVFTPIFDS